MHEMIKNMTKTLDIDDCYNREDTFSLKVFIDLMMQQQQPAMNTNLFICHLMSVHVKQK